MISICIATFKRPQQLEALLLALLNEIERPQTSLEIVVCDNDAMQSAKQIVDTVSQNADLSIRYYCEPQQNISLARNKTVNEAQGEWLAFIDDDELPSKSWLVAMYSAANTYKADGVFGQVVQVLPKDLDASILAMGFYPPPNFKTGAKLNMRDTACGNALINKKFIKNIAGPFDVEFGLTGGEDTLLFGSLIKKHGADFIWCAESIVYEMVSDSRCTRAWLIRRAYRSGQAYAEIERKFYGNIKWLLRVILALVVSLLLAVFLPITLLYGRSYFNKNLVKLSSRVGQLTSLLPWRFKEYIR